MPVGTYYIPATATKPNPALGPTWTWFSLGDSSYNALQVDLNHRFGHGVSIRGVYTWSKSLDDGDSLNSTTAGNAPGLVSNPFDLGADWGPATYDVRNIGVISALYELPFGRGRGYANNFGSVANGIVSGWSVNSIVTLQQGFPFTPQLSYNPTNNGDTKNPVRPFLNPDFTGPVITGNPTQWFNPSALSHRPPPADSTAAWDETRLRGRDSPRGISRWKRTRTFMKEYASNFAPSFSICSIARTSTRPISLCSRRLPRQIRPACRGQREQLPVHQPRRVRYNSG